MSEDLTTLKNTGVNEVDLSFTEFSGGARGVMLQITQGCGMARNEPGYIQLTKTDARKVLKLLELWSAPGSKDSETQGDEFEQWYQTYWKWGSSTDRERALRAWIER